MYAPYSAHQTAQTIDQVFTSLATENICDVDRDFIDRQLQYESRWNDFSHYIFDYTRLWLITNNIQLDSELTQLILEQKFNPATTRNISNNQQFKSTVCPENNWQIKSENNQTSIVFDQPDSTYKYSFEQEGTLILPLNFTTTQK